MVSTVPRHLLIGLAFITALFQVQAAPVVLAEFPFQYREGLLWVEVTVPKSSRPLNFLVDSGAGVSVINLKTARKLGLKLGRKVAVSGVETTMTGYWQQHLSAQAGMVRLPDDYLALDLGTLSRSCEKPVDGLVGADFFRDRVVQIDFAAQKIRLLKPEKATKSDETGVTLPLQLRPCGIRVAIRVNHHEAQWVRLDTGCATALQWVTTEVPPGQCSRKLAVGLAKIAIPQTTTTVGLGRQEFANVPTGLHETAIFPGEAGLLGNGLLARFASVTIDAPAGRVTLADGNPTP